MKENNSVKNYVELTEEKNKFIVKVNIDITERYIAKGIENLVSFDLIKRRGKDIEIDLRNVKSIEPPALGVLLRIRSLTEVSGQKFTVLNSQKEIESYLREVGLGELIPESPENEKTPHRPNGAA